MSPKRRKYGVETFKMVLLVGGVFALMFYARDGGFSKAEGIVAVLICSFISFFLGRISVQPGPPEQDDDI